MPPPGGKSPVVDDDLRAFFQSADLALGNLEAPIGSDRVSGNRFQISQDTLSSVLEHLGIDAERCILSIANNHIGDAGLSGARRTVTNLRQMGLGILGRVSKGEGPAVQVRIGPLAIELVAWTQWMNHPLPPDGDQICQQSQALSWLEAPRRDRADLTIALPHWGYEFIHTPRPEDRQLAAHLAARGVNIIAGNHAHVIQPAESLGEAVCFYGLGGLVQGRGAALRWPARLGSILMIDVEADDPRQQTKIPWGYEVIPIVHVHERKEHRIALSRVPRCNR